LSLEVHGSITFLNLVMKEFPENYFEPIRDLFFRIGIKSVTMDNVCSELGISKRTLYQKFIDKNHMVKEIFYKDFSDFKSKVKSAHKNSFDAIQETCILFRLVKDKQGKISASTLYDLKKYYYPVNHSISKMTNQLVIETLIKTIKRGITEGNFRKDVEPVEVASLVSFFLNSFLKEEPSNRMNPSFSQNDLLNYHLNSICTSQGVMHWERLKQQHKSK
jgi:TetR/AcrR family transcriptional regulator, cholesterol catabolism regulator